MKKQLAVTLIPFTFLTGCATSMTSNRIVTNSYESDLSDRVIRSYADRDEWDPNSSLFNFDASPGPALLNRSNWTDKAKKYRWANTFVHTGPVHYSGYFKPSFAKIADGIPRLHRGDIIDVLYKKAGYEYDLENLKAETVVKFVCAASDKKCIKDLEKSNKWGVSSGYEVQYSKEFLDSLTFSPVR